MATLLPYDFDTTTSFRKVLTFVLWLEAVMAAGIVYSLAVSRNYVVVAQLLIVGAIAGWFASKVMSIYEGSAGTLTRDLVEVERGRAVLGMVFPGPAGRYPISQFAAVRLVQVSEPVDASIQGGAHARIYLVGRPGTPDILIAREHGAGVHLGQELAQTLGLRFEDTRAPY